METPELVRQPGGAKINPIRGIHEFWKRRQAEKQRHEKLYGELFNTLDGIFKANQTAGYMYKYGKYKDARRVIAIPSVPSGMVKLEQTTDEPQYRTYYIHFQSAESLAGSESEGEGVFSLSSRTDSARLLKRNMTSSDPLDWPSNPRLGSKKLSAESTAEVKLLIDVLGQSL